MYFKQPEPPPGWKLISADIRNAHDHSKYDAILCEKLPEGSTSVDDAVRVKIDSARYWVISKILQSGERQWLAHETTNKKVAYWTQVRHRATRYETPEDAEKALRDSGHSMDHCVGIEGHEHERAMTRKFAIGDLVFHRSDPLGRRMVIVDDVNGSEVERYYCTWLSESRERNVATFQAVELEKVG